MSDLQPTFTAVIQRAGVPTSRIEVERVANEPPTRIRLAVAVAGSAAFDVYVLQDAAEWPLSAAFEYSETIFRDVGGIGI